MRDPPATLLAATISTYWLCAGVMIFRVRRKTRKPVGVVPEQGLERLMWIIWVPLIAAWITLPYLAISHTAPLLAVPELVRAHPALAALRWAAALCGVFCLAMTIECWLRMGKSWRIAVTPRDRTKLVTDGLYAFIRHPIYALSILLMLCSAVVVATLPMLVVAVVHITLMLVKARNEERFLLENHGDAYAAYCRNTGRFFPRIRASRSQP
jgi:protein-S-isoprenylcysteine O-methyltransferase Ste14